MDWSIGDPCPADAVALAGIMSDWVHETEWMPVLHSREDDLRFVADLLGTHHLRVARSGSNPLGFLARQGGLVQALHVATAARGQGIGKALLDEVKLVAPQIELWTFQANRRALAFYRREGFDEAVRTDGRDNDEGLPDVCLIWRTP